jgi:hypothetical protein
MERRPRIERAPKPWTDGYSNNIGSYRLSAPKNTGCRRQVLPKFHADALGSIRQKKKEKLVGLEERKREVQKQIADVERSLNLISSGSDLPHRSRQDPSLEEIGYNPAASSRSQRELR